jgi:CBS domain-containing protein
MMEAVMKIKDVMTPDPVVCAPDTNLAAAAELLLRGDCGILPIVDNGHVIGIVTDRDMYIALATRNKPAAEIFVRDVGQKPVFTCSPEDDVHAALASMAAHRVRRLVVEGFGETPLGIVSIDDLVGAAGPKRPLRNDEVIGALRAITSRHHALPHVTAA